ncbi:DUF2860 domain-containing protein [Alteromonas aestuariivivens]|uniref:DUF2860 domain-containing protein n=1 Tax=Alteromonas aestuariivivens TaxID=1938339 RepID=A0A3D8M4T9_9ALTE|nr:DUF2860 family protein [Alteromonas aestuariivivens]RDV24590.1 DUF2860 domain-containing protein [Alteromonas aestuariivivens]
MFLTAMRLLVCGFALTSVCYAQDASKIPEQGGWSGRIGGGMSYQSYSSNVIAGSGFDTISDQTITSLEQKPDAQQEFSGNPFFDIRYTFEKARGQAYIGFLIQDAVRLDFAQSLGYRQQVDGVGILSGAYVFSAFPNKIYQDTYLVGQPRQDTDRKSRGFRIGWQSVFESPFSMNYTFRTIHIDEDSNGQSAFETGVISAQQQALLAREGRTHRLELQYDLILGRGKILSPTLLYRKRDLDGNAMAGESYGAQLSYALFAPKWSAILNGYYGKRTYNAANPLFDDQFADANEYSLNANLVFRQPFNWQNWSTIVSASLLRSDSELSFFDMDAQSIGLNLLYSF